MRSGTVIGFRELAAKLNTLSEHVQQEVKDLTGFYLNEIEMQAIRDAPGPGELIATEDGPENLTELIQVNGWSPISQQIAKQIDPGGYSGRVVVNNAAGDIAIWVEFGTGQSAKSYLLTVPEEWREVAARYYRTGRGTIINKPYLLPAYYKYRILYIREIKEVLKDLRL